MRENETATVLKFKCVDGEEDWGNKVVDRSFKIVSVVHII